MDNANFQSSSFQICLIADVVGGMGSVHMAFSYGVEIPSAAWRSMLVTFTAYAKND